MAEHCDFIAHLQDPLERTLILKDDTTAQQIYDIRAALDVTSLQTLAGPSREIFDFKAAAEPLVSST